MADVNFMCVSGHMDTGHNADDAVCLLPRYVRPYIQIKVSIHIFLFSTHDCLSTKSLRLLLTKVLIC